MSTTFLNGEPTIYFDYLPPTQGDTVLDLSPWSQEQIDIYNSPLEHDWPSRSYYASSESDQKSPLDFVHLDPFDSFSPTGVRITSTSSLFSFF